MIFLNLSVRNVVALFSINVIISFKVNLCLLRKTIPYITTGASHFSCCYDNIINNNNVKKMYISTRAVPEVPGK